MESTADHDRYNSLEEMKAGHSELLRAVPVGALTAELTARIHAFLASGSATGAVLDNPADRRVAQGLLDYWKSTLYTMGAKSVVETAAPVPPAILVDFQRDVVGKIAANADAVVANLHESDRDAARRIVLRLVRLGSTGREFHSIQVPRAVLEEVGVDGQGTRIVAALIAAGVVRTTPGSTPGEGRVELAAPHLIRTWPRLAAWLQDRLSLRTVATLWDEQGRHSASLVSGPAIAVAESHRDLNSTETQFVSASRAFTDRRRRVRVWGGFILVLGAIGGLTTIAILQWRLLNSERVRSTNAEESLQAEKAFRLQEYVWGIERERLQTRQRELEKRQLELEKKAARVANINRMIRALSDIVVAEGDYLELAKWRWEQLRDQLRVDPFFKTFLETNEQHLTDLTTKPAMWERGESALAIAHLLRDSSIESRDDEVMAMMRSVREVSYGTAERVVLSLVAKAMNGTPYDKVGAYQREFWRLYWGPLGVVESQNVARAMYQFGTALSAWETESQSKPGAPPSSGIQMRLTDKSKELIKLLRAKRGLDQPFYPSKK